MAQTEDDLRGLVVDDLRKLRKGAGLTVVALEGREHLLAALGQETASGAYEELLRRITGLGYGRPARALRAAFGIEPATANSMEHKGILKERRAQFGQEIGVYTESTLIGYENKAIDELAVAIVHRPAVARGKHVTVEAWVDADKIIKSVHSQGFFSPKGISGFPTGPSLPALIYQVPESPTIESLALRVAWPFEIAPDHVWAYTADSWHELMTAPIRKFLCIPKDWKRDPARAREHFFVYHEFGKPRPGMYYVIAWQY